jgi:[acyl-carrier-protein] S-malonyltransferase
MVNKAFSFLFPGQGAQYVGMGRAFHDAYPIAKHIFEQADDVLQTNLSKIIFEGPEASLTETKVAQPAIFVASYAILQSLQHLFDLPLPVCTAGLSLGEYTALAAAGVIPFEAALRLVNLRGSLMHAACEKTKGTMLVILGLPDDDVRAMVEDLRMPNDIWCANFNCPGQVVVSGTYQGIEAAEQAAKARGVRKAIRLQVHGAFHSGLMMHAEEGLEQALADVPLTMTNVHVVMNVTGKCAESESQIRSLLKQQVTSSVLWNNCIKTCEGQRISCFLEIGCGKTLAGLNKRIGVSIPTISIESIDDLKSLESVLA